jgi:hypothetical protein
VPKELAAGLPSSPMFLGSPLRRGTYPLKELAVTVTQ